MKNYSARTFGAQATITDRALRNADFGLPLIERALRRQLAGPHRIVKTQPLIEIERDILYLDTTITASAPCWTRQSRAHHHR
jgi:hypothetical protein